MIVPYAPTPIRTRPYFFLGELVARGHQVTLVTLRTSLFEAEALKHWEQLGVQVISALLPRHRSTWNSLRALPTPTPLQAVYCWQPTLARQLTRLLGHTDFDACHVEHIRGALYGRHVQNVMQHARKTLPVIWDSVDCISSLFEQASAYSQSMRTRLMTQLELGRTRNFEGEMVHAFDTTVVTTAPERTALLQLAQAGTPTVAPTRIQVVPNGVDSEYFKSHNPAREPATILFSGKMSYHANLTAATFLLDEIMPRVWHTLPQTRVLIAGENPPFGLRRRAQLHADRVELTGSVPDIRPYLERATVACAPMVYGVGVQNKILEAMAMALPVVASELAARSLDVQDGRELLIGANADALAAQLVRVLQNDALRARLAYNARTYVEIHHRWQDSVVALEALYGQPTRNESNHVYA